MPLPRDASLIICGCRGAFSPGGLEKISRKSILGFPTWQTSPEAGLRKRTTARGDPFNHSNPPKEPRLPEPSPRSQPGFDRRYGHAYMPGQLEMRAMRWQHARCDRRAVLRSDRQIAFRRRAFPYISACSRLSTLPRHATLHVNRAPASGCMHCGRNRGCA